MSKKEVILHYNIYKSKYSAHRVKLCNELSQYEVYHTVAAPAAAFSSPFSSHHIQHTRSHPHFSCHHALVVSNNMITSSGKRLARLFFDPFEGTNKNWTCQLCKKEVKQERGYTDLCAHNHSCHKSDIAMRQELKTEKSKKLFKNISYSRRFVSGHRWLEMVISDDSVCFSKQSCHTSSRST